MCYHGSKTYQLDELEGYYKVVGDESNREEWVPYYHENGFDHAVTPVLTAPGTLGYFTWGLIPWYTKTEADAMQIRVKTLNCISEEMFDKPSFRDSLKEGKRCLVPMSGFFEWRWEDLKGKEKSPHYIYVKEQPIFSVAGIYSSWKDKSRDLMVHSYSVLTTKANALMEGIHNSKKRMPVILPREYEMDWLNPSLTKEDVLALCQPFDTNKMDAYPISKLITSRKENSNVPKVLERVETGRLF